ncbi:hypothetical protein D3C76_1417370 [compost metagenome]
MTDDQLGCFLGGASGGVDANFRVFRRFIGGIDAGEIHQFATASLFVQTFWIPLFCHADRCIDEHFEELALFHQLARHSAFRAEW